MPATSAARARKIAKTTVIGRLLRDHLVFEFHLQGKSAAEIAKLDGRTLKTIQRLVERYEREGLSRQEKLLEQAPVKIIEDMLRRSQLAWEIAATTAIHTEADSVRIGGVRTMLDADERILEVLQSTGHMPRELGTLRHLVDVRAIAITMIEAVRALETGDRTPAEVRGTFEDLLALTEGREDDHEERAPAQAQGATETEPDPGPPDPGGLGSNGRPGSQAG